MEHLPLNYFDDPDGVKSGVFFRDKTEKSVLFLESWNDGVWDANDYTV
jgi:hypothetical protein